jgi:hypothetical protein
VYRDKKWECTEQSEAIGTRFSKFHHKLLAKVCHYVIGNQRNQGAVIILLNQEMKSSEIHHMILLAAAMGA